MAIDPKDTKTSIGPVRFASIPPQKGAVNVANVLGHVCQAFSQMTGVRTLLTVNPPSLKCGIKIMLPHVTYTPAVSSNDFLIPYLTACELAGILAAPSPSQTSIKLPRFHVTLDQTNRARLEMIQNKKNEFNLTDIGAVPEKSAAAEEVQRKLAVRKAAINLLPSDYPIGRLMQDTLREAIEELTSWLTNNSMIDEQALSKSFLHIADIALLTVLCKKHNPGSIDLQVRTGRQLADLAKRKTGISANADIWAANLQSGFDRSISESASRGSKSEILLEEIRIQIDNIHRRRAGIPEFEMKQQIDLRARQLLQIYNCLFNIVNALYDVCSFVRVLP